MPSLLLPNPERLRQIPPRFSWIDHRLVREHYIERCSTDALALYLFLLTVADPKGLSYYSPLSLMKRLKMDASCLAQVRSELIQAHLIAYQHPLYQVLSLEPDLRELNHQSETPKSPPAKARMTTPNSVALPIARSTSKSSAQLPAFKLAIQHMRQQLSMGDSDD
ncbi:MAG: hypothetical protein QNL62_06995 [Gammaproteobacteria bacterium]|nr:hypothetical protein [Gammaproteobacteria bacterium]